MKGDTIRDKVRTGIIQGETFHGVLREVLELAIETMHDPEVSETPEEEAAVQATMPFLTDAGELDLRNGEWNDALLESLELLAEDDDDAADLLQVLPQLLEP